ncbi:Mobile element protein [hydrothermal vent metagenome]|uniref:Mobile element protein n=1 Tax=hydrothermal vent metagenome TaxID=652676 RepID=A0A3B0ZUA3_9ZZZZ
MIIPNAKKHTSIPIIREQVKPDSIVYTDTWRSYNALHVSEFQYYRINHSQLFANKRKKTPTFLDGGCFLYSEISCSKID